MPAPCASATASHACRIQSAAESNGERAVLREDLAEVAPLEELHDHVRRARFELADVEHARHVLALQAHCGARLAKEALDRVLARHRLFAHELERDELIELDVPRCDHDAHAARSEDTLDAILPRQHISLANRR